MYLKPSVSVSYFLLPFLKDLTVEAVERGGGEQADPGLKLHGIIA